MISKDHILQHAITWFFELLVVHGIDSDRWNWAEDEGPEVFDVVIDHMEAGFWIEARLMHEKLIFISRDRLGAHYLGHIDLE